LYPTKSTQLAGYKSIQKQIFGSPQQIVTNKGFYLPREEYYQSEKIEHVMHIALPKINEQVKLLNRAIILILSKLSIEEPTK